MMGDAALFQQAFDISAFRGRSAGGHDHLRKLSTT
jgi:hypothetical protein